MTVQQLFKQIGFEAIMSALQNTHRNDKSIKATAMYKQAFDKLLMTEPSGRGGEVTFDVTPRDKWFTRGHLPMLANGVEGDLWEDIVGKEVVRPVDNPFTDAELAGAILWGATFYGFTDHNRWFPHEEIYSEYGHRARELELRLYRPYIRDKETIKRLKNNDFPHSIAFSMEVWELIHIRKNHQNRHKRKRYYRLDKRIEQLKKLDKRVKKIDEIQHDTGTDLGDLKERIMQAASICEEWRECHTCYGENRADYAIDLMSNYFPTVSDILSVGEEVLIIFYTSPANPLTAEESARLKEYIRAQTATSALHFLEGINPDMTSALDIQFISISDKVISDDDD